MSPMVFEKSLSMAQNLALQEGRRIENHYILVVDLAESSLGLDARASRREHDPAYYLRYNKTFSRMGGTMRYLRRQPRLPAPPPPRLRVLDSSSLRVSVSKPRRLQRCSPFQK